jgi:hypothetical protein
LLLLPNCLFSDPLSLSDILLPKWLDESTAEALLHAEPNANILHEQAAAFVQRVVESFASLQPHLDEAAPRADTLYEAHRRLRTTVRMRGVNYQVKPQLPPDVLGIFVYLPVML